MNIYEIPAAYEEAYAAATDEETGEVDEGKLGAMLAAIEGEVDEKLQRLGEWFKDLSAEEDAIDAEIKALRARREAKAAKADAIVEEGIFKIAYSIPPPRTEVNTFEILRRKH